MVNSKVALELLSDTLGPSRWHDAIIAALRLYLLPSRVTGDMGWVRDNIHPDAWSTFVRLCETIRGERSYYTMLRRIVDDVLWVAKTDSDRETFSEGLNLLRRVISMSLLIR